MKKPKIEAEEQSPRKIIRADKAPTTGYSLVVDGHFKSHHDTVEAAEAAGMALMPSASWASFRFTLISLSSAALFGSSLIEILKINGAQGAATCSRSYHALPC